MHHGVSNRVTPSPEIFSSGIGKFSQMNSEYVAKTSRCFLRVQPSVSQPAAWIQWRSLWSGSNRSLSSPSSSGEPPESSAASRLCWETPQHALSGRRRWPGLTGTAPLRGRATSPAAADCPESFSGLQNDPRASLRYLVSWASLPYSQSSRLL